MDKFCFILALLLFFISTFSAAQTDSSFIVLQSGEVVTGKVEYKSPFLGTPFLLMNDSTGYQLEQVQSYQNEKGYFCRVDKDKGRFVRRVIRGNIDLYRETATFFFPGSSMSYSTPAGTQYIITPGGHSTTDFDYFSKGDGEILEASYDNLLSALSDKEESVDHLKTYHTLKYVSYGLIGGGLGLLVAGLATSSKDNLNTGLVVTGVVVAVSSWIPYLIGGSEYEKAISTYNR